MLNSIIWGIIVIIVVVIAANIWIYMNDRAVMAKKEDIFRKILDSHGIWDKRSGVCYEAKGEIKGIAYESVIVNNMLKDVCVGKDCYIWNGSEWKQKWSRDKERIWNDILDITCKKYGCSRPEAEKRLLYCQSEREVLKEQRKNEIISQCFRDEWFPGYEDVVEYFKELKKQRNYI